MSLGWQSESALLPSKAKPIHVDGRSMLSLKALVYDAEQKLSSTTNSLHHKRKHKINNHQDDERITNKRCLKDDRTSTKFVNKNSVKTDKNNIDDREKKVEASLRAKAELYDQLVGNSNKTSDSSLKSITATSGKGPFLVNFNEKKEKECNISSSNSYSDHHRNMNKADENDESITRDHHEFHSDGNSVDTAGFLDILDEFGRTKRVHNKSDEYQKYLMNKEIEYAKEILFQKSGMNSTHAGAELSQNSNKQNQWAWSNGQDHPGTADWLRDIAEERGLKALVEDKVEKEVQATLMSDAARVKTQWDKTLQSSAKGYLSDIHKESELNRKIYSAIHSHNDNHTTNSSDHKTGVEVNKTSIISGSSKRLNDRRELLKQKQSQSQHTSDIS